MSYVERTVRTVCNKGGLSSGPVYDTTTQHGIALANVWRTTIVLVAPGTTAPLTFAALIWNTYDMMQITNLGAIDGTAGSEILVNLKSTGGAQTVTIGLPAPVTGYIAGGMTTIHKFSASGVTQPVSFSLTELVHPSGAALVNQQVEVLLVGH